MKNIIAITSLLAAGAAFANAEETIIFDVTNATPTYDSSSILSLKDVEQSGASVEFELAGASCSISLQTTAGVNRGYLGSNANWTNGLPAGIGDELGLSAADISTITGSAAYVTGNVTTTYPGKIIVSISGLNVGTYNISGLMAKATGDTSPTSWNLTLNGSSISADASYYSYSDSSWSASATEGNSYGAVSNNQLSAYYMLLDEINVVTNNSTLVLTLEGTPVNKDYQNLKALQFLTLTSIPEPSAFGLLAGLGALALAGTRRRRRK